MDPCGTCTFGLCWIAYIGHHGGVVLNPLTGQQERNGVGVSGEGRDGPLGGNGGNNGRTTRPSAVWNASQARMTR